MLNVYYLNMDFRMNVIFIFKTDNFALFIEMINMEKIVSE